MEDVMPDTHHPARARPTRSARIRAALGHPVVDADGHVIEFGPAFLDYLKRVAGAAVTERYLAKVAAGGWFLMSPEERIRKRVLRPSTWSLPAKNTLDRATAMLPRLFRERMDDIGLDFSIVYSTHALRLTREVDEELRRATCRALNTMLAELYRDQRDRMTPVAAIPAHTPGEAIEELEFAVKELGMKAAMITSNVKRPVPEVAERAPELAQYATWMDPLCMDGPCDYDPLWAKCVELKVAVTAHTGANGHGSRLVTNNYVYNHVGQFAAGGEAFAKAVVLGGVTRRFPTLNFGFLEGGVCWATELYNGLVAHCSKRHSDLIYNYDEQSIDRELLAELFARYGGGLVDGKPDPGDPHFLRWAGGWHWPEDRLAPRELDAIAITRPEDLRELFEPRFYFGCEADDPLTSVAFNRKLNPFGATLKAMFSSDVGHWDVPDMEKVLEEAYEMVERGLLSEAEFREFVFVNPVMLHAGMNPDFFKGTVVEQAVDALLQTDAGKA
jgi:predicted TIM-barrel fold metal-dependent hydrolase